MSRNLAANCGSLDSLNWRIRCGCKPWARQIRCVALRLMPTTFAIARPVQCVTSPGGSINVRATTRSATSDAKAGTRDGRVLSRRRPSTPACMNRSCQRHTAVLALPVRRMISVVPQPSAVSRTICARHTCFCGLFRSDTTASRRARSAALTSTTTPVRIPQIARPQPAGNPLSDSSVRLNPLRADLMPAETRALLVSVARVVLVAQRGSLFDQLDRLVEARAPPRLPPTKLLPVQRPALRQQLRTLNSSTGSAASPTAAPSM